VHVVALNGKMKQTKPSWIAARRAQQREANRGEKMLAAQWGKARAQGDVDGLGSESCCRLGCRTERFLPRVATVLPKSAHVEKGYSITNGVFQ
jgi:hypothetical protein